jgi:glucokinase
VNDVAAVGVDVGGTHLRVAAIAADGTILARRRTDSPADDSDALVAAISDDARAVGPGCPVGVGVAGVVTPDGTVRYGPNLAIRDLALRERLSMGLGVDVTVLNDATAAVLGEQRVGAARNVADVVLLTVGTGIGGGIVADGRLVRGAGGLAGEIGHLTVVPGGRPCGCGGRGHVEAHASGRAIETIAREMVDHGVATTMCDPIDASAVVAAARGGDTAAKRILDDAAGSFGVAVATVVTTLDPALIVLGGGAGASLAPWYVPAVEAALVEHVFAAEFRTLPQVRPAALGDDAGVIGAALAAMDARADEEHA